MLGYFTFVYFLDCFAQNRLTYRLQRFAMYLRTRKHGAIYTILAPHLPLSINETVHVS